jgi:hypothetical protein
VNTLEDRLRDAYRAAAETVRPETLLPDAILSPPNRDRRRPVRGRLVIPLAAAAAVIALAAVGAVLLPRAAPGLGGGKPAGAQLPPAPLTTPGYFVALDWMVHPYMFVVSATTGKQGASITLPFPAADLTSVATGDGQTFVVAASEPGQCRTSLYRFSLGADGTPTAMSPFATVPGVVPTPWDMAVSASGQILAYDALACGHLILRQVTKPGELRDLAKPGNLQPQGFLAVVNVATGQTKRWTFQDDHDSGGAVSISANGSVVGILNRVLDTSAAPGSLAAHSRVVATDGEFGPSTILGDLSVSPGGTTAYFATFRTANDKPVWGSFQLRAFDLATGQARPVRSFPGVDVHVIFDPTGRYVLGESVVRTGPTTRLARVDIGTGQLTQLNTRWAVNPEIAW